MPTGSPRRTTAADIARLLKLSPTTVSLVLNDRGDLHRIPVETQARVMAAARELNYRPNAVARQLAGKRSNTIGFLINTQAVVDPRLIQFMDLAASSRGMRLLVGHAIGSRERVREYLEDFRARGVDGLVSIFHNHPDYRGVVPRELALFDHVVFYEKPLAVEDAGPLRPCYVQPDFGEIGRLTTRHLLDRGRRRIGLVFKTMVFPGALYRRQAYEETLRAAGIEIDDRLVWVMDEHEKVCWTHAFTPELAMRAVEELVLNKAVDGIVAVNDLFAARIVAALRQCGRRVPDDVAVVGCDDLDVATLIDPPLTTINVRVRETAEAITRMIFEFIDRGTLPEERRGIVIPPELIVRQSS